MVVVKMPFGNQKWVYLGCTGVTIPYPVEVREQVMIREFEIFLYLFRLMSFFCVV